MVPGLLWPGLHRAGDAFTDSAYLRALVAVEAAWLDALAASGLAPVGGGALPRTLGDEEAAGLAEAAEAGGNPVIPLVAALRRSAAAHAGPDAAAWVHRGLTSQDVVDTALLLCAREVVAQVRHEVQAQVDALSALADAHRGTLTVARTLTQHALPTTFAARVAGWLTGLLDARDALDALAPAPAQFGGAVGTLASLVELLRRRGTADPERAAADIAADAARRLGLAARPAWHTARAPVTALGDALVTVTDALGHLANDVLTAARSEVAELREPAAEGRGGSSTMPHKRNPALSVLLRRTAESAPLLAAQLHLAAAGAGDERPAGSWHAEWAPLALLARAALAAARQASELVTGLEVDTAAMARTLEGALPGVLAERLVPALAGLPLPDGGELGTAGARAVVADARDVTGLRSALSTRTSLPAEALAALLEETTDPRGYLGTADLLVDAVLARAKS